MSPLDDAHARAREQLKLDEGYRRHAYVCPAGAITVGYGRNIDKDAGGPGISAEEAGQLLDNDIAACGNDLSALFPAWVAFSHVRKAALINLRYQLGPARFRAFRKMIAAIDKGDWLTAAAELADSNIMKQTPIRTARRVNELEIG